MLEPELNMFLRAEVSHVSLIQGFMRKAWHDHYPNMISPAQIDYMLDQRYSNQPLEEDLTKGIEYYLAFKEDLVIGCATVESKTLTDHWLIALYIDKDFLAQGVGKELMNLVFSQKKGYAHLYVNRKNILAINFYFKQGFTIESLSLKEIGQGYLMDDYIMVKDLLLHNYF